MLNMSSEIDGDIELAWSSMFQYKVHIQHILSIKPTGSVDRKQPSVRY